MSQNCEAHSWGEWSEWQPFETLTERPRREPLRYAAIRRTRSCKDCGATSSESIDDECEETPATTEITAARDAVTARLPDYASTAGWRQKRTVNDARERGR